MSSCFLKAANHIHVSKARGATNNTARVKFYVGEVLANRSGFLANWWIGLGLG